MFDTPLGATHLSILQPVLAVLGSVRPVPVLNDPVHLAGSETQSLATRAVPECPGGTILTTRSEREVLNLTVAGRTGRVMAATLFISERTVSKHFRRILRKQGAVSCGDAAVRLGLLSLSAPLSRPLRAGITGGVLFVILRACT